MSKEILVRDLEPGQNYIFQTRAKDQYGQTSSWSTAFKVLTNTDTIAPNPVTGLNWVVSGTSFKATWVKPVLDSNSKPLKDFKDYKIILTAGVESITYYVSQETFDFSLEANINSFGQPEPGVEISVQVRDVVGNLSTAVTDTATNPVPTAISGLVASSIYNGISVTWEASPDDDLKTYEVYLSTSGSGFTPGPSNIVHSGLSTSFVYQSTNQVVHYVKVRAIDVYNQATSYASASATPTTSTSIDTDPPANVATLSLTTGASLVDSYIDASWTAVADTDLQNYIIRYSEDATSWRYINIPSDQTTVRIDGLQPNTSYYVAVKAVDFIGNASSWTNATTYPITSAADTIAPSKPNDPTIATNPLSIQFSHDGTKDAGGNLEADVEFLEVHFSETTGFTPSSSTLVTTLPFAGPGLPTISRIVLPVTTSVTTGFWKTIAVDFAGNKSTPSDQVSAIPGLIQNAYILDATISSAKIQSLSAAKLEAGTAIINDLFIRSELIIDNADGIIRSSNYNAGTKTGWKIDEDGLTIYDGIISADALQIQDSQNIIPAIYADFEWHSSYYHDDSDIPNEDFFQHEATTRIEQATPSGGAKIGLKALRVYATGFVSQNAIIFAAEDTYPLDVAGGETYIYSVYIKNNIASAYPVRLGFDHTLDGTTFGGETEWEVTLSSSTTTWNRYYSIITLPVGAIGGAAYIEIPAGTNPDFYIDAIQIERQTGGIEIPSPFTPPSSTTIDGGSIVTGVIRSSAPSPSAPDQPAWSLDATGNAQFGDVLIRGSATVGAGSDLSNSYIQSSNYSAGSAGWIIKGDGESEFNSVTLRGFWRIDGQGAAADAYIESSLFGGAYPSIDWGNSDGDVFYIQVTDQPNPTLQIASQAAFSPLLFLGEDYISLTSSDLRSVAYDATNYALRMATQGASDITYDGWTNLTLSNGWTNTGSPFASVGWKRMPDGTIMLRGIAQGGTQTDFTTVFTLPVGSRPAWQNQFHIRGAVGTELIVKTDGVCQIAGYFGMPAGSHMIIDGIRFSTL